MADVVEINDLEQLQQYQPDWELLFQRTPRASFFHTYEWFVTYWKHFGAGQRMRVLVVRSGETVIGIMPLCVVEQQHRLGKVRVLTYPLSDWGMWYGPLGPHQSATMFMALQHLRKTSRDWDMIDFRWTPCDPAGHDVTRRAMMAVGWRPQREVYQQSSLIEFAGNNWEAFFAGLNKKWRNEICRQDRNLAKLGQVEFIRHRPDSTVSGDGDPRWDLYEECVAVSRQSWQANVTQGNTICHASVLPFITECHQQAARLGMIDITLLRLNGKALAFQYNYHHRGDVFGLRMGYASAARDLGVGKILLTRSLKDSFERGDKVLDLGIGDFDFKTRIRTGVATSHHYSYSPWNSWKSQGVRLSHWLRQQLVSGGPTPAKPAVA